MSGTARPYRGAPWHARAAALALALVVPVLALAVALRPLIALAVALPPLAIALAAAAWTLRPGGAMVVAARAASAAAAVALAGAGAMALATYPVTTALLVVVLAVVVSVPRAPAAAFAVALLLFSFQGPIKILLLLEETPLPGGGRAVGAAALDLALFAPIAYILVRDRLRAPRRVWARAEWFERIVIGAVCAWLALSVAQVAQGGDLVRGAEGFRLFQTYTLVGLATLTILGQRRNHYPAVWTALAIGFVVSAYSALRVVTGPTDFEYGFAVLTPVSLYGDTLRAIGSFTSAVALSSYLAPFAAFAFVLGLLARRLRAPAWAATALALVGLVASFSRASLFATAVGVAFGASFVMLARNTGRRRRAAAATAAILLLAGIYGGLQAASRGSPALEARAKGVLNPLGDESVQLRLDTWSRELEAARRKPLGEGIGSVGAASSDSLPKVRTTDNSLLKVLVEQGVLGLALFVAGMFGAVVALARRLRLAEGDHRGVGIAALSAFVAFLALSLTGETVEQPGKVVAWGLLGTATALGFGAPTRQTGTAD